MYSQGQNEGEGRRSQPLKCFSYDETERPLLLETFKIVLGEHQHRLLERATELERVDIEIERENFVESAVGQIDFEAELEKRIAHARERSEEEAARLERLRRFNDQAPDILAGALRIVAQHDFFGTALSAYVEDLEAGKSLHMRSDQMLRSALEAGLAYYAEQNQPDKVNALLEIQKNWGMSDSE